MRDVREESGFDMDHSASSDHINVFIPIQRKHTTIIQLQRERAGRALTIILFTVIPRFEMLVTFYR
jgi:hypothetical protein